MRSPHVCLSALYEHGVVRQARTGLFRVPASKIGTFEVFCVALGEDSVAEEVGGEASHGPRQGTDALLEA